MVRSNSSVSESLGLILIVLCISVLVPAIFISLENPQTAVYDQTEGKTTTITGELTSEIVSIDNQDRVNVTVVNRRTGDVDSTMDLQEGDNTNVTIGTETVNIRLIDVVGSNSAIIRYEYPLYLGWPGGVEVIIENIADIIILISIFLGIGLIFTVYRGFSQ